MKTLLTYIALTTVFLNIIGAQTGLSIMKKNDAQVLANDESVDLKMILTDSKKRSRERQVTQFIKTDAAKNRSSIIQFSAPADVKGTSFLAVEHTGREDDQWLYLPALRKTRRISSSDQTDNFVGSDFTYEDLNTEDLDAFKYTLKEEATLDGVACYHIEAIPVTEAKKKETGYSKRELYIRKNDYVAQKIMFFDKNGAHTKTLTATNIKPIAGTDKSRAYQLLMENHRTNHNTTLVFNNFKINKGVEEDLFSKRNLERNL